MPIVIPICLPKDIHHQTWKISGEYRIRYERRLDKDFKASAADNESILFQRGRATLDWSDGDKLSGVFQYQYSHALFWRPARNSSDSSSHITQLNLKAKTEDGTFTIGRQRINIGTERLVGAGEWTNVGRSFDGVRFTSKEWDVFGARIGHSEPWPADARLFGASHLWPGAGTTSLFYKADADPAGDIGLFTLDHAQTWKTKEADIDVEAALQFGHSKGKNLSAWALHAGASRAVGKDTKLGVEFNTGTGGGSANSTRTFDNLYPTNHKFFGMMDLFSWKNSTIIMGTLTTKAAPSVEARARVIAAWLNDSSDAWYGAAGRAGLVDASGSSGRTLGHEIDFELTWKRTANETAMAGYGFFTPGGFVKKVSGEGTVQHFLYVQYLIKF